MNATVVIIATIALLIVIIVCVYCYNLSKLKMYKSRLDGSVKVINEELENRFKLVLDTKPMVNKVTKKEMDFYKNLEEIKNTNISSYDLDIEIKNAIETIRVIDTDYKKLSEKKEFKEVLRKLEESDTKITAAKSFYNKNNECLIGYTKKIVPKIIAKLNKIKIQPSYETVELFDEDMKVIDE
jgi:hypothetical protein